MYTVERVAAMIGRRVHRCGPQIGSAVRGGITPGARSLFVDAAAAAVRAGYIEIGEDGILRRGSVVPPEAPTGVARGAPAGRGGKWRQQIEARLAELEARVPR